METFKALALAKEKGLDLVEIAAEAKPPICKIIDYGQFKYQKAKEEQKQKKKQKKVEIKGVRISLRISENDFQNKVKQAEKFFKQGHKVRVELVMRGRELAHKNLAYDQLRKFLDSLPEKEKVIVEQAPKRERRGLGMIIRKK